MVPNVEHRFCTRHLEHNFLAEHRRLQLKELLWQASKATYVQDFEWAMQQIKDTDEATFQWLSDRPASFWSRAYFPTMGCYCDVVHNNMCESFNGKIVPARNKPLLPMLEEIRLLLMQRMQQRREAMRKHDGVLCLNIK